MDRNTQVEIVNTCIVNALRIDEEHRMMIIEKITQNLTDENRAKLLHLLNVVGRSKSFAEGVKVQIIANTRGHDFEIGEIVTIGIQDNDMWLAHGEKSSWWIAEHEANVC